VFVFFRESLLLTLESILTFREELLRVAGVSFYYFKSLLFYLRGFLGLAWGDSSRGVCSVGLASSSC